MAVIFMDVGQDVHLTGGDVNGSLWWARESAA